MPRTFGPKEASEPTCRSGREEGVTVGHGLSHGVEQQRHIDGLVRDVGPDHHAVWSIQLRRRPWRGSHKHGAGRPHGFEVGWGVDGPFLDSIANFEAQTINPKVWHGIIVPARSPSRCRPPDIADPDRGLSAGRPTGPTFRSMIVRPGGPQHLDELGNHGQGRRCGARVRVGKIRRVRRSQRTSRPACRRGVFPPSDRGPESREAVASFAARGRPGRRHILSRLSDPRSASGGAVDATWRHG